MSRLETGKKAGPHLRITQSHMLRIWGVFPGVTLVPHTKVTSEMQVNQELTQ